MKEYAFESLRLTGTMNVKLSNYQAIFREYAQKGYQYVGYLPTEMTGHGQILSIDLIFEKDV